MRIPFESLKIPFLAVALSAMAACGGGGGDDKKDDDSVVGLKMPVQLSVVVADSETETETETESGKVSGIDLNYKTLAGAVQDTSGFSSDSDYVSDETQTYVYDASMQSLQTVNMILCLMDQTKASDMVNEGAYVAMIDEAKCEQGSNGSGAQSGTQGGVDSSSDRGTQLNRWTIESTREDKDSPQIVKLWIPPAPSAEGDHPMDNQTILGHLTITEGVSATKPFGSFVFNFKGVSDMSNYGGSDSETVMEGTLKAPWRPSRTRMTSRNSSTSTRWGTWTPLITA